MTQPVADELVPDDVIPHRHLPPLRYRDMPEPVGWTQMVGPSIILAGMALGSGEFLLWPYITYKAGFVFFWACLLGVATQFFLNMEIERWTLITGESAVTGFCRLSRQWAWVMLVLTIIPFAWPGWATGGGNILSWLTFGPVETVSPEGVVSIGTRYSALFGIAGLLLVGAVLTAGPVVYNTVEKLQFVLVGLILALVVLIAVLVVRWDAVVALAKGSVNFGGLPPESSGLTFMALLGALAFAGAGGSLNLGQSNYVKDKGYGMGRYIGRITSPVTGQEEAVSEVGYHFRHTPENMARWRRWWKAANVEHFFSFFVTCVVCLCLLALIAYSLLYTPEGTLKPGVEKFGDNFNFVWGEATVLARQAAWLKYAFLGMGVAILLTTELGVLDAVARVCADIVKTNYLAGSGRWSVSKLYFVFLWGEIALGVVILAAGVSEPKVLVTLAAAMNGAVMFLYSMVLVAMNYRVVPPALRMSGVRLVAMLWSCAFFGYFTVMALRSFFG